VRHHDLRFLERDDAEKQADTGGDRKLEILWDRVDDVFAQPEDGNEKKDDARAEHAGEGLLPEEQVELSLRSQALAAALQALGEREREVLVLRYGLADYEPKTLEEIGRRLGLTRERVRQIEVEALRRLSTLREIEAVSH
jgi:RNA polymerase primary sigma factor